MRPLELPTDWAGRMSRFSVASVVKIRSGHKGSHRTNRFGSSMEFSDFREYHPGDDIRHIDWNVYGRTERVYIKRFLDEQDRSVHLLLDDSASMQSHWLFTRQLAFSLGLMSLASDDRLSMSLGRKGSPRFQKKGKNARQSLEQFLTKLPEPQGDAFTGGADFEAARRSNILIILTDGLEPVDKWQHLLRRAVRHAQDVRLLRIVSKEEADPVHRGDVQLVDSETGVKMNVSMTPAAVQKYREQREMHNRMLESLCQRFGISYLEVAEEAGIQDVIFKQLPRENWIR
ncbi:DUF58 domain-containing protein [Planomicrobium sp. YIM 101495]|uniref:DUF58 domain-containing protein n=1 Tax=Planomicrobium sp. YIM 101495 TaxID=2665160 RepID=UPI0012B7D65E|nr:DUF58 domain-containing protein [Planomicrobium sp. YIM 101495]MTD30398.1 DUF58 domain-containing protein [Planomicrobium sp. YIM 101495]